MVCGVVPLAHRKLIRVLKQRLNLLFCQHSMLARRQVAEQHWPDTDANESADRMPHDLQHPPDLSFSAFVQRHAHPASISLATIYSGPAIHETALQRHTPRQATQRLGRGSTVHER